MQFVGVAGEICGGIQHHNGRLAGLAHRMADPVDVGCYILGPARGLFHVTGNFRGGIALLLDGAADADHHIVHFTDPGTDALNQAHRIARGLLNLGNLAGDLAGGAGGLGRQRRRSPCPPRRRGPPR